MQGSKARSRLRLAVALASAPVALALAAAAHPEPGASAASPLLETMTPAEAQTAAVPHGRSAAPDAAVANDGWGLPETESEAGTIAAPGADIGVPAPATDGATSVSLGDVSSSALQDGEISLPPAAKKAPADAPSPQPSLIAAAPSGDGGSTAAQQAASSLDSSTIARIAARLVALQLLDRAEDAQNPTLLGDAVRAFQSANGIAATGTLDRDTVGRLLVG